MCFPRGIAALVAGLLLLGGCGGPDRKAEPFGKTYYLDGAGNWGFGTSEVPRGLRKAGYRGDVEIFHWSVTFNPLLDQINLLGSAERAGKTLAKRIKAYKKRYPYSVVNIIALSAGTGVAVWACEQLDDRSSIDNMVFLGSSLSRGYNVARALQHVKRKVYVYHSPHDAILGLFANIGTIDHKIGAVCVGQQGLIPPPGMAHKVVNTPWSQGWRSYGWNGGHTDCTRERFVRYEIARRILTGPMLAGTSGVEMFSQRPLLAMSR